MSRITGCVAAAFTLAVSVAGGRTLLAQTVPAALGQLGLTEASARKFVMDEIDAPSSSRRSAIAIAGTRAFLKLPPAARGPAATVLFAWAKNYVNSAAFKTWYATFRKERVPDSPQQYERTVDEEVRLKVDEQIAAIARMRQIAATLPPADAAQGLQFADQMEAPIKSGEFARRLKAGLEIERASRGQRDDANIAAANDRYPADPKRLVTRRLREFLDTTADADFSAPTISLTGGPDGIEFVNRKDQKRSWVWQEAVIAGREATTAARPWTRPDSGMDFLTPFPILLWVDGLEQPAS